MSEERIKSDRDIPERQLSNEELDRVAGGTLEAGKKFGSNEEQRSK